MVVFGKIFMSFEKNFEMDRKKDWVYIINERKGWYPKWRPQTDKNIMTCMIVGEEAKRVEKLDQETLKDEI